MNFKNKLRFTKSFTHLFGMACFIGCFTFQGCEDTLEIDPAILNKDRFISIPYLDNPETLMQTENVSDYLEAYNRF